MNETRTRLAVIGSMKADLEAASKPKAFRPVHLCNRDCEDEKMHNDHAYQVAQQCQERYVEAAQRRLDRYVETGGILNS